MERQFHTQFFRAELKVCIVELSRVTQRNGETTDLFISRFKKMRNRYKIQGMKFRDFYELAAKVIEYEELLEEESYRRKKSMGACCQEVI